MADEVYVAVGEGRMPAAERNWGGSVYIVEKGLQRERDVRNSYSMS